jgi:hypothetical protein
VAGLKSVWHDPMTGRWCSAYRDRAACLVRSDPLGGVGFSPLAGRTYFGGGIVSDDTAWG